MAVAKDITGQKFGRLTVIGRDGANHRKEFLFLCICDCGNQRLIAGTHLRRGKAKSCGCLQREHAARLGHGHKKHGHSNSGPNGQNTVEYRTWKGMVRRCTKPAHKDYAVYYGGRGIKVCDRWLHSYENFLADMGKKPGPEFSIDRIDNDGNYEPSNCRWATRRQQRLNQRKH